MSQFNRWLLPEGIAEALPEQAERLERYRRRLLDLYRTWGYELVIPPFIEYLESLLTGTGHDLDLQTFKLTDQLTGRMMGVRADMTPQVARIDAHLLKREEPARLCYLGTVLHTRPSEFSSSRSPMQVGAELFGHSGMDSDLEVISLMMETLKACGVPRLYMDLGHVGVYRSLAQQAGFDEDTETQFFDLLQRKSIPEIEQFVAEHQYDEAMGKMLLALPTLTGGVECLEKAEVQLAAASDEVLNALDYVKRLSSELSLRYPELEIHYDFAELRGFHYQTGVVFAAYADGLGQEIARGGRYDGIGKVFGRARPATGFSADLKVLLSLTESTHVDEQWRVWAPAMDDAALREKIAALRGEGHTVLQELAGQSQDAKAMNCNKWLLKQNNDWSVVDV